MPRVRSRRATALVAASLAAVVLFSAAPPALPACCYFSALEKDVEQPGQRAFLTWDPVEKVESFTVQPQFEGNAEDFGMVVPTPSQPRLNEMDRDFFKHLAVFTILKPMDVQKFKSMLRLKKGRKPSSPAEGAEFARDSGVVVLESGVVGSLDYKIVEARRADDLYSWLKDNGYAYSGDEETLGFYIQKKWFFTVMRIDPKQMKRGPNGRYRGEVTPTRFTFESDALVYPLRITRISVKDKTDALFYVQAPEKMDLQGDLSFQFGFQSMWSTAYSMANWDRCNEAEKDWWAHVGEHRSAIAGDVADWKRRNRGGTLTTLEWSRRLTAGDIGQLSGVKPFDRKAPAADVKGLSKLVGTLRQGQFVTKLRHVFRVSEMTDDLVFVPSEYRGKRDTVEHIQILPTSPP